jgi:hypothetical protein
MISRFKIEKKKLEFATNQCQIVGFFLSPARPSKYTTSTAIYWKNSSLIALVAVCEGHYYQECLKRDKGQWKLTVYHT